MITSSAAAVGALSITAAAMHFKGASDSKAALAMHFKAVVDTITAATMHF